MNLFESIPLKVNVIRESSCGNFFSGWGILCHNKKKNASEFYHPCPSEARTIFGWIGLPQFNTLPNCRAFLDECWISESRTERTTWATWYTKKYTPKIMCYSKCNTRGLIHLDNTTTILNWSGFNAALKSLNKSWNQSNPSIVRNFYINFINNKMVLHTMDQLYGINVLLLSTGLRKFWVAIFSKLATRIIIIPTNKLP